MSFDGILWIIIYAFIATVIIIAILKKCKIIKKKEKTPTRQAIEIIVIIFVALLIVGLMVVEWIRQEEFRKDFVTEYTHKEPPQNDPIIYTTPKSVATDTVTDAPTAVPTPDPTPIPTPEPTEKPLQTIFDNEYVTIQFDYANIRYISFRVKNKTKATLSFDADAIAINGVDLGYPRGGGKIAPNSTGYIGFETENNLSSPVERLSGTIEIMDFSDAATFKDSDQGSEWKYEVTIDMEIA